MSSDNLNIWGPPAGPANPPAPQGVPQPYGTPVQGQHFPPPQQGQMQHPGFQMPPQMTPQKQRRIRWGLLDVLWGFLLMFLFQLLIIVPIIAIATVQILTNNESIEDPELLINQLMNDVLSGPTIFVTSLSMYLAWWLVTRRATKKKGLGSYVKDFWLKFRWLRDITMGFLLAVALRLAEQGIFWFLINVVGVDMSGAENTSVFTSMSGLWFVLNAVIIAGILGPFFEEFFFRGLFLQASMRFLGRSRTWNPSKSGASTWLYRNRVWLSIIFTSVVFGMMHFQGDFTNVGHWIVVAQTGIIGVILAVLTVKTKRLGPAITAHIFFNLSGVILATLLGG